MILLAWMSTAAAAAASGDARFAPTSLASLPASARGEAVVEADVPQLVATLVAAPETDGAPARIGVLFDLAPGWHLYWRNPGETGVAPEIVFDVPGQTVGALEWPAPETFREADDLFTTYGYAGRVLLGAPLARTNAETDASMEPATTARVDATVLVCRT